MTYEVMKMALRAHSDSLALRNKPTVCEDWREVELAGCSGEAAQ